MRCRVSCVRIERLTDVPPRLAAFVRQYQGSSFPTLARTEDGRDVVVKMHGAGNGMPSLLSEFVANRVARTFGWPVPDCIWIEIEDGFPWNFGTDEFDDIVTKSFGWNLGIEYMPELQALEEAEYANIPPDVLQAIFTLDLFFLNTDRAVISRNVARDREGRHVILDHGSLALFQVPTAAQRTKLYGNHFLAQDDRAAGLMLDERMLDVRLFARVLREIPERAWKLAGRKAVEMLEMIERRIEVLQNAAAP